MRRPSSKASVAFALSLGVLCGCTPTRSADASPPPASAAVVPSPPQAPAEALPHQVSGRTYVKPSATELKARLTPLQFEVTQNGATEAPFQNVYWDNHEAGLYVDVATGEPLFSSRDKFESGTGWPSFTRPIEAGRVVEHTDTREVKSASGSSHLGHFFEDGPPPTGLRYCIDSAALRFIPVDRLAAEGYASYAPRFGVAVAAESPPPATANSCASPPPGETPGCNATLDVAIFARAAGDDRVVTPAGVLEVTNGMEGSRSAIEVAFDPSKLSYADLLTAWTKGREKQSLVFVRTDAQRKAAAASAVRVADAVPFQRQ